MPTMIPGCGLRVLNAVAVVILASCRVECGWAAEPPEPFTARELTTEQALELVTRQSTKPSLDDVADEGDFSRLLDAAGLPPERITDFRDAVRGLDLWPTHDLLITDCLIGWKE